jgi:hypothetical protein
MKPLRIRRGAAAVVLLLALGLGTGRAAADEPGESDDARVLVQQAIALIVNSPDDEMAIAERVEDALSAPRTEGVDLALVRQAEEAVATGDSRRARALLQQAIGGGPYLVLDAYDPRGRLDGGDWVLLGLSATTAAGGLVLARRWRPPDTIRSLRQMPRQREAS